MRITVLLFPNIPEAQKAALQYNTVGVLEKAPAFFGDEEECCELYCNYEVATMLEREGIATIVKKNRVVTLEFQGLAEDLYVILEDSGIQYRTEEDIAREREKVWKETVHDY